MMEQISRLLAKWRQALASPERLADWLSPRADGCAACGKGLQLHAHARAIASGGASPLLRRSLCRRCLESIPWLDQIKCTLCGRGTPCEDCVRNPRRSFQVNRSAVLYDATMREWLALYKYRGLERLGPILADMLVPAYERLASIPGCRWTAITFVPISDIRAEERGFNQAEAMAKHIGARFGLPVYSLLERTRHTEKMSFKSRKQRLRDVEGLFAPRTSAFRQLSKEAGIASPTSASPIGILLIDDIYTTGSTAGACALALKEGGSMLGDDVDVYVLTWAHS